MFNIAESIAQSFIARSQENLEWLMRRHGKPAPAPLVIDMESYGSMVETNKDSILKLYLGESCVDIIQAKKNIALEAIDPKPDSVIKRCLETLVAATGRYSKIIIVDAPSMQETKNKDFGEAAKAAMTYQGVDHDGNVDMAWVEAEEKAWVETKDYSEPVSEKPETHQEAIPQAPVEDDEHSQLIYSHKMSPEETETLFANAISEGEAKKKKVIIGAAGSTDPVIDDNAKNPILGKKKQGSGYTNQNPNLHRGPKRPNMRM